MSLLLLHGCVIVPFGDAKCEMGQARPCLSGPQWPSGKHVRGCQSGEKLKALGEEATVWANPIDPDHCPAAGSTAIAYSVYVCECE